MEAIGATASILAVLQVTATVIRVSSEYIRGVKGATKSAEAFRKELRDFRGILEELEEHSETEKCKGSGGPQMKFLLAIEEPLAECQVMLSKIERKLTIPTEAKRIGHALLWPFREKEIEKHILSLRNFKESFHLALSLDNTVLVKDIWTNVKDLGAAHEDKQRGEVIKWLEVVDTSLNYSLARSKHQEKTGTWFLESEDFNTWYETRKSSLWLNGIPGCGKTILSSSIIHSVQNHVSKNDQKDVALAYFYFDFNDAEKQKIENFLSCILAQLCRNFETVPTCVRELHVSHSTQDHHSRPTIPKLLEILFEVSKNWRNVYLVLDALDECDSRKREDLFEVLDTIFSSEADIRLLVTSRPELDIQEYLGGIVHRSICIQSDKVDADIGLYVRSTLRRDLKMKRWPASDKQTVEDTLTKKARGMFRWVFCQLETLRKCMNRAAVLTTLKSLPKTLDQTYERIVLSIPEEYRYHAIIALHWLAYSRKPLKLVELAEAVAVKMSEDKCHLFRTEERLFRPDLILEICSSLVSASGTQDQADVRLAHFSVQEYLVSERLRAGPAVIFSITKSRADEIMAEYCVSYMCRTYSNYGSQETRSEMGQKQLDETYQILAGDFPLLKYAVEFWYQHANCIPKHNIKMVEAILHLFKENSGTFCVQDWWKFARYFQIGIWYELSELDTLGGPIGVLAYLGLLPELETMLGLGLESKPEAEKLEIALHATAYGRHLHISKILLENGADPNAKGGIFGRPLQASAYAGDNPTAVLLLKEGADLDAEGGKFGTALQAAAYAGHLETVKLLLENGTNPNTGIGLGTYGSALQAAAYQVEMEIVELLLKKGADPNADGGKYGNSLQAAAYRSHKEITQLLINYGADPNLEGGEYGSALQASTHWGDIEIIELLLDNGANPNASSGKYAYGTALQAATNWGTKEIVELLLKRGADANADDGKYGSAMETAIFRADRDIIELLLNHGAEIPAEDQDYKDLLKAAASRSTKEVIDLLLDTDANPNADIGCYGKAVQLAALRGYKEGVKLKNEVGESGSSAALAPRHYATLKTKENLALILPGYDVPTEIKYSSPFTPLHWAAWHGHGEVVHVVAGMNSKPTIEEDIDPLQDAKAEPNIMLPEDTSKIKKSLDVDINYGHFENDWSPLHVAIFRNHRNVAKAISEKTQTTHLGGHAELKSVVMLVLEDAHDYGDFIPYATRNLEDGLGWSVCHVAALLEKPKLLEYLSETMLDLNIDMPDNNGMTALHWVAAVGRKSMIELLLSLNANPDATDQWGRIPIDLTAGESRIEILDLLAMGDTSEFPKKTILSHGINCASWRVCDSCDVVFRHGDLFLHCEACNDLDLCEHCLLQERGCKDSSHSPELWDLRNRMASLSKEYKSVEDILVSRAAPHRNSSVSLE